MMQAYFPAKVLLRRLRQRYLADVGQPDGVGPLGDEVAVEQVRGDRQVVPALGGPRRPPAAPARPPPPPPPLQPRPAHHPLDAPARVPPPPPAQLGVAPPRAVGPPADGEDA